MRNLIIGFMVGLFIGTFATLGYASLRLTLENGVGTEIGTTSNPIVIQTQ